MAKYDIRKGRPRKRPNAALEMMSSLTKLAGSLNRGTKKPTSKAKTPAPKAKSPGKVPKYRRS